MGSPMLPSISTRHIIPSLPVFLNTVSFVRSIPTSAPSTSNHKLSSTRPVQMEPTQYEHFGMDNDPKCFPKWCHQYFKHKSYSEVRLLPMEDTPEKKFGHLINDTLLATNGFRMRCFVNNSQETEPDPEHNTINITDRIPPEGVNKYRGFIELRTTPTQLIFLVDVGTHCCGHRGIWHGGVTSAILDNTFGFLGSIYFPLAATKTLNVKFIRPIYAGTPVLVSTEYIPDSSFKDNRPEIINAESFIYLPTGKIAAIGKCEIVDVSNKWTHKPE